MSNSVKLGINPAVKALQIKNLEAAAKALAALTAHGRSVKLGLYDKTVHPGETVLNQEHIPGLVMAEDGQLKLAEAWQAQIVQRSVLGFLAALTRLPEGVNRLVEVNRGDLVYLLDHIAAFKASEVPEFWGTWHDVGQFGKQMEDLHRPTLRKIAWHLRDQSRSRAVDPVRDMPLNQFRLLVNRTRVKVEPYWFIGWGKKEVTNARIVGLGMKNSHAVNTFGTVNPYDLHYDGYGYQRKGSFPCSEFIQVDQISLRDGQYIVEAGRRRWVYTPKELLYVKVTIASEPRILPAD